MMFNEIDQKWYRYSFCPCGYAKPMPFNSESTFFVDRVCPECGSYKSCFEMATARRRYVDFGFRWYKPWTWKEPKGHYTWQFRYEKPSFFTPEDAGGKI